MLANNINNNNNNNNNNNRKEMIYLTIHTTHFIYGYMASYMLKDHSFRLSARVLLYVPTQG